MTQQSLPMVHGYRDDPALRQSYNTLAAAVFGLDFEPWYQSGYWGWAHDPHSLLLDGEIVSNVSVNWIDGQLDGQFRRYIQLGTVMTRADCRGRGYNCRLMEAVLGSEYACDGVFLYGNDSVLEYYPKFGFQAVKEYRYRLKLDGGENARQAVPMEAPEDWAHFLREKNVRKSLGRLRLETDGLLMFYLTLFMRDTVFYLPELDAYAIAQADGDTLTLYDVYARDTVSLADVCRCFGREARYVTFAFTPQDTGGLEEYEHRAEDTTLFICGGSLAEDLQVLRGFPELAHT